MNDQVVAHVKICKNLTAEQINLLYDIEAISTRRDIIKDVQYALLQKHLISEARFEALVAPWVKVMGRTWEV